MSPAFVAATILAAGWNLALVLMAAFADTGLFRSDAEEKQSVGCSHRTVRAEIGQPEFDVREEAWKREMSGGTAEYVGSSVADTPREVDIEMPYTDACVTVMTDEGRQVRHCSVCMN